MAPYRCGMDASHETQASQNSLELHRLFQDPRAAAALSMSHAIEEKSYLYGVWKQKVALGWQPASTGAHTSAVFKPDRSQNAIH